MKIKRLGLGFSAVALTLATVVTPVAGVWAEEAAGGSGTIINSCGDSDALCVTKYEDLVSALANANIAEIRLDADIDAPADAKYILITRKVTIDLNGKTLNLGKRMFAGYEQEEEDGKTTVHGGADVTIKDSSADGKGTIVNADYAFDVVDSKLTLESGTLYSKATFGVFVYDGGSVTVNGGTISADSTPISSNNTTGDANFYVNGGKLISRAKCTALYMPTQVDLQISGEAEIYGSVIVRMGNVKISGGTIYASSNTDSPEGYLDYSGSAWLPAALGLWVGNKAYTSANERGTNLDVEVTGGKFVAAETETAYGKFGSNTDKYASAVALYDVAQVAQNINVKITDGTFIVGDAAEAVEVFSRKDILGEEGAVTNTFEKAISGGVFNKDQEVEIADGYETEKNADGNTIIVSKTEDLSGVEGVVSGDDADELNGEAKFFKSLVADRKATLKIKTTDTEDLTVDTEKAEAEVVAAFEIGLFDRNDVEIEVKDNEIVVYISLTAKQYETLSKYDSVKMLYFNEDGEEEERLSAAIYAEPAMKPGDEDLYVLSFRTTHFSTYAVAGVNDEGSGEAAPNTGMFTAQSVGASEVAMTSGVMALISTVIVMYGAVKFAKN